jgi:hypothetical protein
VHKIQVHFLFLFSMVRVLTVTTVLLAPLLIAFGLSQFGLPSWFYETHRIYPYDIIPIESENPNTVFAPVQASLPDNVPAGRASIWYQRIDRYVRDSRAAIYRFYQLPTNAVNCYLLFETTVDWAVTTSGTRPSVMGTFTTQVDGAGLDPNKAHTTTWNTKPPEFGVGNMGILIMDNFTQTKEVGPSLGTFFEIPPQTATLHPDYKAASSGFTCPGTDLGVAAFMVMLDVLYLPYGGEEAELILRGNMSWRQGFGPEASQRTNLEQGYYVQYQTRRSWCVFCTRDWF